MITAVLQAAVDAAMEAMDGHDLIERWRCSCGDWEVGVGPFDAVRQHATHRARAVAAAVVAAAQGPIKAEAVREAADEWQINTWHDVLGEDGFTKNPIANAQRVTDWLRARADRIEAEPPADAHTPEERILRDILTNQPE